MVKRNISSHLLLEYLQNKQQIFFKFFTYYKKLVKLSFCNYSNFYPYIILMKFNIALLLQTFHLKAYK
ncbi:hypothetical protein BKE30_15060 [Alkanindiges hydrocarboniclasticus]|uniref:Uncharacterized protein n=1 Tax=Alkanindiges hydrocarboniclasticus TaxID=1907941 RepID=A0A1S8CQV7_9GAMM|nr:hypothetical protein BKE30_15060 [Alkanindiges hydrocarboniclasticus]